MMGLIVGMFRFILEIAYGSRSCIEDDDRPLLLTKVRAQMNKHTYVVVHMNVYVDVVVAYAGTLLALWHHPVHTISDCNISGQFHHATN